MTDTTVKPPALDPQSMEAMSRRAYPEELGVNVWAREWRALGNELGLTHFGVNMVTLPPGTWSSLRHWHSAEDEFVFVLEGEVTLVTDAGEQVLSAGMVAGFPAGKADGHHFRNLSDAPAVYLEIGDRAQEDDVTYPDADLYLEKRPGGIAFYKKNGEKYDYPKKS